MAVQNKHAGLVETHHREGRTVSEVLGSVGWRDELLPLEKGRRREKG